MCTGRQEFRSYFLNVRFRSRSGFDVFLLLGGPAEGKRSIIRREFIGCVMIVYVSCKKEEATVL